jgi:hypothetical protein
LEHVNDDGDGDVRKAGCLSRSEGDVDGRLRFGQKTEDLAQLFRTRYSSMGPLKLCFVWTAYSPNETESGGGVVDGDAGRGLCVHRGGGGASGKGVDSVPMDSGIVEDDGAGEVAALAEINVSEVETAGAVSGLEDGECVIS